VSGGGENGGSAQVVPTRARGDDFPPFVGFVAETVAQSSPLILGNCDALPRVGHNAWDAAYKTTPAVQWLVEQHRER
jgi:hypothetical protein